jgi:hypothetical protein
VRAQVTFVCAAAGLGAVGADADVERRHEGLVEVEVLRG